MSDLFDRVMKDQNALQSLLAKIPGFKGYTQRTNRREADKMIRESLADRFEEQWKRISQVQKDMISEGGLDGITELESSSLKLRQFIDRTRRAAYGYAGFFDAIKINEEELNKVYDYDLAMFALGDEVARAIDNIEASLGSDGQHAALRHLRTVAQQCVDTFNRRQEAMIGGIKDETK